MHVRYSASTMLNIWKENVSIASWLSYITLSLDRMCLFVFVWKLLWRQWQTKRIMRAKIFCKSSFVAFFFSSLFSFKCVLASWQSKAYALYRLYQVLKCSIKYHYQRRVGKCIQLMRYGLCGTNNEWKKPNDEEHFGMNFKTCTYVRRTCHFCTDHFCVCVCVRFRTIFETYHFCGRVEMHNSWNMKRNESR